MLPRFFIILLSVLLSAQSFSGYSEEVTGEKYEQIEARHESSQAITAKRKSSEPSQKKHCFDTKKVYLPRYSSIHPHQKITPLHIRLKVLLI